MNQIVGIKIKRAVVAIALSLVCSISVARSMGTGGSGGGGAFVCRENGQVANSELIDLWEARALDGRQIEYSDLPFFEQVEKKIELFQLIDENLASLLKRELAFVRNNLFFVPNGVALAPPSDINHGYEKPGCPASGMMYYDGERKRLSVQKDVFEKLLSETDRAAAIFHEVFYAVARTGESYHNRPPDSTEVRKFVGCVFSKDPSSCLDFSNPIEVIPREAFVEKCVGRAEETQKETEFYVWPVTSTSGKKNFAILVTKVNGQPIASGYLGEGFAQAQGAVFRGTFLGHHRGLPNFPFARMSFEFEFDGHQISQLSNVMEKGWVPISSSSQQGSSSMIRIPVQCRPF